MIRASLNIKVWPTTPPPPPSSPQFLDFGSQKFSGALRPASNFQSRGASVLFWNHFVTTMIWAQSALIQASVGILSYRIRTVDQSRALLTTSIKHGHGFWEELEVFGIRASWGRSLEIPGIAGIRLCQSWSYCRWIPNEHAWQGMARSWKTKPPLGICTRYTVRYVI